MSVKCMLCILLLVGFVTGCDIGYTRVTNNYPEPVYLKIFTSASGKPLDIVLTPGNNIIYREQNIFIKSIVVISPDGGIKKYDSETLEKIAADTHKKIEVIQWSVRPDDVFASLP